MTRINITERSEHEDGELRLVGWFEEGKAEGFAEDTYWDGNTHVGITSGQSKYHQKVYRTAGGRWVLNCWSNWQGSVETYEFMTADRAREWLMINGHDKTVATHFGEIAEESGPSA